MMEQLLDTSTACCSPSETDLKDLDPSLSFSFFFVKNKKKRAWFLSWRQVSCRTDCSSRYANEKAKDQHLFGLLFPRERENHLKICFQQLAVDWLLSSHLLCLELLAVHFSR